MKLVYSTELVSLLPFSPLIVVDDVVVDIAVVVLCLSCLRSMISRFPSTFLHFRYPSYSSVLPPHTRPMGSSSNILQGDFHPLEGQTTL